MSRTELSSCVRVEVAVPDSPSLISLMVSVGVTRYLKKKKKGGECQSSGAV